jgi:hypothetical protein
LIDAPIITNDIGASNVGKTSATLNGAVSYTGGESPTAYFYWGTTDEGEDRFAWEHEEDMGTRSGSFSKPLDSLTEGETYYYRTYGENSAGSDWADSTEQFTCGCLAVEDFEVTQINDYQFDFTWTPKATITTIRMGIDNSPANAFDGTLVYRGNGTATSWYCDTQCTSGNMTFRAWSDCTACLTCTTPAFSDTYEEDSVILSGSCGGGSGDMTKAVYDTNDDGVVDEADYAALAGDSDTLDGHHWIEIPAGGGNVTFVTDAGNVTGTLFYLLGSGTISTSGSGDTIIINGTTFLSLPDTPDSYVGQGGRYVAVNGNETAVEFVNAPAGGDITFVTDSGNATSIASIINVLGSGNTTVSGSGSTVIIDSSGNVTNAADITFVTASGNATSIGGIVTLTGTDIEITGNSSIVDFEIGGENVAALGINMLAGVLGIIALCMSGLAVWSKLASKTMTWLFGAAGAAWIILGMYGLSTGAAGTTTHSVGWFGIVMGLVFFFGAFLYRERAEEAPTEGTWDSALESRRSERYEKRYEKRKREELLP